MAAAGHPRRTGIWLLAAGSLLASLAFLAVRLVGVSDGAVVAFDADAWTVDGVRVDPIGQPHDALRSGDVVIAVDGRPLEAWLDGVLDPGLDRSRLGSGPLDYSVKRDGETATVRVGLAVHDVSAILEANWSVLLFTVVLQVIAVYVLLRRPGTSAAVALVVAASGMSGSTLPWLLGLQVSDVLAGWPFLLHALTAGGLYMLLWPAGALHLPLALSAGPEGPGRRTLAVAYAVPLAGYGSGLLIARLLSPTVPAWLGTWAVVQLLVIIPTVLIGLALTVRGFRAAGPAVRGQIRWAAIGGGIASLVGLVVFMVPQLISGQPLIPWSAAGLVALPLPIGIAVAILRRGLFDFEAVVNRSLVYGLLTLVIVGVYVGAVAVVAALLTDQAGFLAALLATGIVAVVVQPARDALQRSVNRLMYGHRDEPYVALTRLGERLESALEPDAVLPAIVSAVAGALRAPFVAIELLRDGVFRSAAAIGAEVGETVVLPLSHGGEAVGRLLVAPRGPGETFGPADRRLLEDLARQAGVAARAFGLTEDLRRARLQLVTAQEEERRRLGHELRGGLESSLVGLEDRLMAARSAVPADPAAARAIVDEARRATQTAVGEIRRFVYDLRPPALDELGLLGAVRQQAVRLGTSDGVQVTIKTPDPLPILPAAVEVAAYRIAVEALGDAVGRAGARHCQVVLDLGETLDVAVTHDGEPRPEGPAADAMAAWRDLAAELGGTVVLERMGGETRLLARLPVQVG